MGFDLYGMNPYNPNKAVKPVLDWDKPTTEEQREEYFKKSEEYRNEVVGDYFRSNVWWWRPLADYVIKFTGCVEEDDINLWHENSGHEVDDETAKQIHNQLQVLIESGHTQKFQDDYEKERKKMEKHNDKIDKEIEKFCKRVYKKMGKEIAPMHFLKEDKAKWDEIYNKKMFSASYPFSVSHVKEFAEFCRFSGGFKIC